MADSGRGDKGASAEMEQMKVDIAALRDELERLVTTVRSLGESAVSAAGAKGAEAAGKLGAEAEALAGNIAARGRSGLSEVEDRIKEQPLMAVALAFGAGLLVAVLRGRR